MSMAINIVTVPSWRLYENLVAAYTIRRRLGEGKASVQLWLKDCTYMTHCQQMFEGQPKFNSTFCRQLPSSKAKYSPKAAAALLSMSTYNMLIDGDVRFCRDGNTILNQIESWLQVNFFVGVADKDRPLQRYFPYLINAGVWMWRLSMNCTNFSTGC